MIGVVAGAFLLASVVDARAQAAAESPWVIDVSLGMDFSIAGDVNKGAIGVLQGQAAAVLPQPYGEVYGTGFQLRGGVGYMLDEVTEVRGIISWQRAEADLVRLGDLGPSSLYAEYSDYQTVNLDVALRRYYPFEDTDLRFFGEAAIGAGFIDDIDVEFAAPQSNAVFSATDFYDRTAAFTWSLAAGIVMPVSDRVDVSAQIGLRHVSGLTDVDQFIGTGLEEMNDNSSRLTFPLTVGLRFKF
jgi:hypothetical protein